MLFANTISNVAKARQVGDLCRGQPGVEVSAANDVYRLLEDLEPAGAPRWERQTSTNRFISSGLESHDSSA